MTWRVAVKRDKGEKAIVEALRDAGYTVQTLEQGKGVPDLLVCNETGKLVLMEVKQPGEKLTPAQVRWHANWPGRVAIVHSPMEALSSL